MATGKRMVTAAQMAGIATVGDFQDGVPVIGGESPPFAPEPAPTPTPPTPTPQPPKPPTLPLPPSGTADVALADAEQVDKPASKLRDVFFGSNWKTAGTTKTAGTGGATVTFVYDDKEQTKQTVTCESGGYVDLAGGVYRIHKKADS